jgi:two-component system CheB/CheR fusion protein
MSVASERLTAVLRAAQYLSNLSPEQDAWAELAQAISSFFGCEFVLVVQADEGGEPVVVRSLLSHEIPVAEVLRQARDEIRSVLATGFLGSLVLSDPACALAMLPLPRDRRTTGVAVVGRLTQRDFSKEELEILLALGGLFGNVVARLETERELRDHRKSLEVTVDQRTFELAASNRRLLEESAVRRQAEGALERAHAELQQIFETAGDGVWVLDCDGKILRVNATRSRRIGRPSAELAGHLCHEVSPCCECDTPVCPLVRVAEGASRTESEVRRNYPEGARDELVVSTPLRTKDGALLGVVQVFHDITERKQAEQALRQSEAELRESDRRKNEFMAMLSHELRNPLAPIRNSLYVLGRAVPGSEQANRANAVINRQVEHLTGLVDDLLDITRISRGKIRLERRRVELNDLVRRTVDDHRSLFEKNGVAIESKFAPEPLFVNADPTRLAQVVGNLLGNAAKFAGKGGLARVRVSTDPATKHPTIVVADSGAGMTEETLAHLFEPFMQGESTLDRSKGGLGLGLALAQELVKLHGGHIRAHSDGAGQGAEFVVSLPDDPVEAAPAEPTTSSPTINCRRVLIIEDNIDAADSLREALELGEHEIAVAYNGPEGIAKARAFWPEVVLCDIGLPGMDGFEVARAFRADEWLKGTYLVALSGYALPEDVQRAEEAGFDRHLAKPPSLEKLERVLADCEARGGGRGGLSVPKSP